MRKFTIAAGLVVQRGERSLILDRSLEKSAGHMLVFSDMVTGEPTTLLMKDFYNELQSEKLVITGGESNIPDFLSMNRLGSKRTITDLPAKYQQDALKARRYVVHMRRHGITRGQREKVRLELQRLSGCMPMVQDPDGTSIVDPSPPSASTVLKWMRQYEDSGGVVESLASKNFCRKRSPRLHKIVLEVIHEQLRTHYCTRGKPTLRATTVKIRFVLKCKVKVGELKEADASVSESTVSRVLSTIDRYEVDKSRFGLNFAENKYRTSYGGIAVYRPQSRYEIDHTVLDIVVVDDRTGMPLGRPTLTLVVDSYTGLIAGFHVSFWPASLSCVLAAMKVAISPKGRYTEAMNLKNPWLPYGLPMAWVVDNGLEFHSWLFKCIAAMLDTDILWCKTRTPWHKPVVERAFGLLNLVLPEAGRVEKRLDNFIPLNPDKTARIPFSSLCIGLLQAVVDILPFSLNERKIACPFDAYQEGMSRMLPPMLPCSTASLDLVVAPSKEFSVNHEGVVPFSLRYNSQSLTDMRKQLGSNFRTLVKWDPEDLSQVYVQNPEEKSWLVVPSCDPEYTTGLSLIQHKAIRQHARMLAMKVNDPEDLMRARQRLAELWNDSVKVGKRLKGNHLRALASLTSSRVLQGPAGARSSDHAPENLFAKEDLGWDEASVPDLETVTVDE